MVTSKRFRLRFGRYAADDEGLTAVRRVVKSTAVLPTRVHKSYELCCLLPMSLPTLQVTEENVGDDVRDDEDKRGGQFVFVRFRFHYGWIRFASYADIKRDVTL